MFKLIVFIIIFALIIGGITWNYVSKRINENSNELLKILQDKNITQEEIHTLNDSEVNDLLNNIPKSYLLTYMNKSGYNCVK